MGHEPYGPMESRASQGISSWWAKLIQVVGEVPTPFLDDEKKRHMAQFVQRNLSNLSFYKKNRRRQRNKQSTPQ